MKINYIILGSFIEGLFGFITFAVFMILIFGTFFWFASNFFGVRYHGRSSESRRNALKDQEDSKATYEELSVSHPQLVNQAIDNCKKKKYSLTYSNVLSEVSNILRKDSLKTHRPQEKSKSIMKSLFSVNPTSNKIDELEKLNKLRREGVISEFQFEQLKKELLND